MSNNTNTIQSQNAAATYERLYQVYNNVAAIDAPNQLMQLPQEIQNQVYGQVFELAGRPQTNDCWWGGHNAFRDLPRLQQAIQRVAFNNYLAMPVEQRNAIAGRVYENSGRPQTNDPQWGQNHANDNVGVLFRSIIEGMGNTTSPSPQPSPSTHVVINRPQFPVQNRFSAGDYANDYQLEVIIRNLSQASTTHSTSTTQTTTTQTTTLPVLVDLGSGGIESNEEEQEWNPTAREFLDWLEQQNAGRESGELQSSSISSSSTSSSSLIVSTPDPTGAEEDFVLTDTMNNLWAIHMAAQRGENINLSPLQFSTIFSSSQINPLMNSPQNSELLNNGFSTGDFVENDNFGLVFRRLNLADSRALSNSTLLTGSALSVSGLGPDAINRRKSAAVRRLNDIASMGGNARARFETRRAISIFNLDAIMRPYSETQAQGRLLELVGWAGIGDDKRRGFTNAVERYYETVLDDSQATMVRSLYSKIFSYFEQKRNQSEVSQEDLKVQCQRIIDKIIDGNRGCVDQMLSQLQDVMLDIAVDAFVPASGDKYLGRILCRAGQELCLYRTQLLKEICIRQNPHEDHMADLEREVVKRVAGVLGMQGGIFDTGARFYFMVHDLDDKVNAAFDAFRQEYRPLEHLTDQLSTPNGAMNKLRNELVIWALERYGIENENIDNPQETDMNPLLSANFNPVEFKDFVNGDDFTPAGTLFLLEAAGLIKQK